MVAVKFTVLIIFSFLISCCCIADDLQQVKKTPALNIKKRPKITLISVANTKEIFWDNMHQLAKAAADDLSVEFEILYSNRNHFEAIRLAQEVSERKLPPDYVIVVGEKNIGAQSIQILALRET